MASKAISIYTACEIVRICGSALVLGQNYCIPNSFYKTRMGRLTATEGTFNKI